MNEFPYNSIEEINSKIKENIKSRKSNDKPLNNWFLSTFIYIFPTFGLSFIYMVFMRIKRIDNFILRKKEYFKLITNYIYLQRKTLSNSKMSNKSIEIDNNYLKIIQISDSFSSKFKITLPVVKINLLIFTIISLLTIVLAVLANKFCSYNFNEQLGISIFLLALFVILTYFFIMLFIYINKMNSIWDKLQKWEKEFYNHVNVILIDLNITKYGIPFSVDYKLKKNYFFNLFLCFITCGIWLIVWDYKIHIQPNNLFSVFHNAEDNIAKLISQSCI